MDWPTVEMAVGAIVLAGLATSRFLRIRRGIGAPEDWIPLVCGLGAAAAGLPLAYLLDQGVIAGSLPRAILVLVLIPTMVIALGYVGIRSGRLQVRLERAYAIVEPYLEDPTQAVIPEGDGESAELREGLDELHRLLLRGLVVPERPELVSHDLEPLLRRAARPGFCTPHGSEGRIGVSGHAVVEVPDMKPREDVRVRAIPRSLDGDRRDVAEMTPGERMGIMWQLTRDAWAFKGETDRVESRLQRHVVRLQQRES